MAYFLADGALNGLDRQAECKVLVNSQPADNAEAWSEFMVVVAPKDLPDGIYRISFAGNIGYTQKHNGICCCKPAGRIPQAC
jgi:hypothetical protein